MFYRSSVSLRSRLLAHRLSCAYAKVPSEREHEARLHQASALKKFWCGFLSVWASDVEAFSQNLLLFCCNRTRSQMLLLKIMFFPRLCEHNFFFFFHCSFCFIVRNRWTRPDTRHQVRQNTSIRGSVHLSGGPSIYRSIRYAFSFTLLWSVSAHLMPCIRPCYFSLQ